MTSRRRWTPVELELLRARYPHEPTAVVAVAVGHPVKSTYHTANALGLRKSPEYLASAAAGRWRDGEAGRATRFQPGQVPHNKGLRRPGWAPGRMAETQFKPGSYPAARWDQAAYGLGALRITTDGSLLLNIGGIGRHAWVMLSRYVWWREHGRWPRRDQVVRSRNGDPYDTQIENLELVSRRENMKRNSIHNYPPDVARLVQLRGALVRVINNRTRKAA